MMRHGRRDVFEGQFFDDFLKESHVIAQRPEIVLIGTGTRQRFPERSILTALLTRRIGVEVMDTAAACRTFNILVAEDRRVVAALFLKD